MKNLATLFILISCMLCVIISYAGENSTLKAEKISATQIDIFNLDNMESLLGITGAQKLTSYEVVLSTHNKDGYSEIFKFDTEHSGNFKRIMAQVKEHALPGSILYIGEIKTTTGEDIPQMAFFLI